MSETVHLLQRPCLQFQHDLVPEPDGMMLRYVPSPKVSAVIVEGEVGSWLPHQQFFGVVVGHSSGQVQRWIAEAIRMDVVISGKDYSAKASLRCPPAQARDYGVPEVDIRTLQAVGVVPLVGVNLLDVAAHPWLNEAFINWDHLREEKAQG
jgi:hypothetical protein